MTHYTNTGNPIDFPKLSTIDKLWGQALDRVVPDTYSSLSLTQVEKVKTVFAELIVKECVEQLRYTVLDTQELRRDKSTDYQVGWEDGMFDAEEMIKAHFGVEE